jgi:hypothetical protein
VTREILDELAGFYCVDKEYPTTVEWDRDFAEVEAVLRLQQAVLEPDDPNKLFTQNWLALAHHELGRKSEAIRLMEQTVGAMTAVLDEQNVDRGNVTLNLCDFYLDAKRNEDAIKLLEPLRDAWQTKPPADAREEKLVATITGNLGDAYEFTGRMEAATACWRQFVDFADARQFPDSKLARLKLASNLRRRAEKAAEQDHSAEAEPLFREALALLEAASPDDWSRFNAMSLLGSILADQREFDEAEPLLIDGYHGLRVRQALLPRNRQNVLPAALDRLNAFYEAVEDADPMEVGNGHLSAGVGLQN